MSIPLRGNVLERDGMAVVHAYSERRCPAGDILRSPMFGGAQATDVVLLRRRIKHGHVAEDETEFKEPLGDGAK